MPTKITPTSDSEFTLPASPFSSKSGKLVALFFLLMLFSFTSHANTTPVPPVSDPLVSEDLNWITSTVKSGDTLSAIADRHHITPGELYNIMQSGEQAKRLTRIKPGDEIHFGFSEDNNIQQLTTRIDEETRLLIRRIDNNFSVTTISDPLERRLQYAFGTVTHSLFLAAKASDVSQPVIMQLAGLFGWDIDFTLDVRSGDQFSVVYEALYRDGEHVRDGNIIAAEYINRGESYRAARYTDPQGRSDYYSPDGKTLRKAFLRSPVDFARISSGFSLKRKHPVLHTIRAHKGVDYAGKPGTPIRSTGDGKIVHRGRKGGYGRTIIIKHGTRYSTLYAHMSRYAKKLKVGSRVTQGQIIGYIGSSGLATGPHLHYEFRADGVHRNPLRFKFPGVAPVAKEYHDDFLAKSEPLFAQLDLLGRRQIALGE